MMTATTTSAPAVRDLFDVPDQVGKGAFVVRLTEAVERPAEAAQTFVVTERLADAFDRALGLVNAALRDQQSKAAYIHGSFGSGKSHFMALLSLLLRNDEEAWRIKELHALRPKYDFIGKKKFVELHFHMVDKRGIEDAIFDQYLRFVREQHPNADLPGLFADEALFADAARMLDELGDERFFARMNAQSSGAAAPGWGKRAQAWNRERFRVAASSTDPEERAKLFSALAKSWFGSFAEQSDRYVDLDTGLGVMSRHAKTLGYDGIVLFLDELILWLWSLAARPEVLHREVQKMVKLVEAQESVRPVPIISFIARQRDLADMVGDDLLGDEHVRLRESLRWWEGRYERITLEDKNLPEIIERRVLKPKDEAAKASLEDAFARLRKAAGASWETLLGQEDERAFRRLYPFSPALVEALVALSSSLQRERTAIRMLMEMLVEHIPDLTVGEVVRVGDLFDVLAAGDDAVDGMMRSRFEAAKSLYRHKLLPLIRSTHGTNGPDRCQRERPDHLTRLGCAGCPEKGCRTDNRIAKTLLIAALVPEVPALKDLTASKLVQLNHGSLKVPIPGGEAAEIAQRLRRWAGSLAQLRVGDGADPSVRLQLEGVDLGPILDKFRGADSPGARQRVLRDILFGAMGVEAVADAGLEHVVKWHNTKRRGYIRFGNVRKLGHDHLRCQDDHEWRLIVDYPFDDAGHGPADDEETCERFIEEAGGSWTLVWLPSFFSKEINDLLGELTILEHIFASKDTQREAVSHLGVADQQRATSDLDNLRHAKRGRLLRVLEQAYGLATPKDGDIDESMRVEQHLRVLKPGAKVSPQLAPNLAEALDRYVSALLEQRYPKHPPLGEALTPQRVERLVEKFGEIIDSDQKKIVADKALVNEMRVTLGELGLVRTTEGAVHLVEDRTLQMLEQARVKAGSHDPQVLELRRWLDPQRKMGLTPEAEDLVIRCYARWAARTFVQGGRPFEPSARTVLADDVVLEKPPLPPMDEWNKALGLASYVFGITLAGKALHADNLKRFEVLLGKALALVERNAIALPDLLERRLLALGASIDVDRMTTAKSGAALCKALSGAPILDQIATLARFEPKTSAQALGRSLSASDKGAAGGALAEAATLLNDDVFFHTFEQLKAQAADLPGAAELLDKALKVLRQDEINEPIVGLRTLAREAIALLRPPPAAPQPEPGWKVVLSERVTAKGSADSTNKLEALLSKAKAALEGAGADVELTATIEIRKKST